MSFIKAILFVAFLVILYGETTAKSCSSNYDCDFSEVCCKPGIFNNQCHDDCIGKSCYSNSDCGGDNEFCCNDKCQEGLCGLAGWITAIIVLSILGVVGTIVGVVLCLYCAHRRRSAGIIVATRSGAAVPATTVVAASSQVNYAGQMYPPVQQPMTGYGPPPAYYQPPQTMPQK